LFVLALAGLLTASEATITSTVLPVIVSKLGGGDNYIWAANGYFLTMSACLPLLCCIIQCVVVLTVCLFSRASLQPMFGQVANVFGRRWPLILSTVAFVIGSGVSGGLVLVPRHEPDITRGINVLTSSCV
jgi:MFS family permease